MNLKAEHLYSEMGRDVLCKRRGSESKEEGIRKLSDPLLLHNTYLSPSQIPWKRISITFQGKVVMQIRNITTNASRVRKYFPGKLSWFLYSPLHYRYPKFGSPPSKSLMKYQIIVWRCCTNKWTTLIVDTKWVQDLNPSSHWNHQ